MEPVWLLQHHTAAIAILVAGIVIALVAFDLIDVTVAGMIGVSTLLLTRVLVGDEVAPIVGQAGPTLARLFGGMVVARTLGPTGLFDRLSGELFRLSRGDGRRFLLGIVVLAAPLSAVLPNATVVILLASVVIGTSRKLGIDFVPPIILLVLVSNTAGLLTLVADPATFYVGSARAISFGQYLARFSPYAILAIIVVVALMPWTVGDIWRARRAVDLAENIEVPFRRPRLVAFSLGTLAVMVLLFVFGDQLPAPLPPPGAAIIGALRPGSPPASARRREWEKPTVAYGNSLPTGHFRELVFVLTTPSQAVRMKLRFVVSMPKF
jgi:Na+/H+ antiporter NhaD/arsenite permease-like protein